MAITRDTSLTADGASASSRTRSYTCSGSNRLLLVVITKRTSDDMTGVTYNGVAMTQLIKRDHADSTEFLYIYGLLNPASGAHDIVASASGASVMYLGATSYNGVLQTDPLTNVTFSASNALALTVTANDAMFVWVQNSVDTVGGSTGSTLINEFNGTGQLESNPLVITSSGSFTMNYTGTSNDAIGVAFSPFVFTYNPSIARRRLLLANM